LTRGTKVPTSPQNPSSSQSAAREIAALQKMLLPKDPLRIHGYELAVHYQPCEAAGGDFYGWGPGDGEIVGMGVADVAGHGLRAAVVMAMLRTWMVAFRYFNRPMTSIAKDLNSFFAEVGDLQTFLTIVLLKLNRQTGEFSIRNCGHPSPKLRRCDGTVATIEEGRMLPLGIEFEEQEVPEATGVLHPGQALVLYTDGVTESKGEDGSFFDDRLDDAIANSDGSAKAIIDGITRSLAAHRGERRQRDDECILVIRRDVRRIEQTD
jgi:sigma-B regulation protein RsbU (phosphoserine phosphatase)